MLRPYGHALAVASMEGGLQDGRNRRGADPKRTKTNDQHHQTQLTAGVMNCASFYASQIERYLGVTALSPSYIYMKRGVCLSPSPPTLPAPHVPEGHVLGSGTSLEDLVTVWPLDLVSFNLVKICEFTCITFAPIALKRNASFYPPSTSVKVNSTFSNTRISLDHC